MGSLSAVYRAASLVETDRLGAEAKVGSIPILPRQLYSNLFGRLSPSEVNLVLRHGLLPIAWLPDRTLFATSENLGDNEVLKLGIKPIAQIGKIDFRNAVKRYLGRRILAQATETLRTARPEFSAHQRVDANQRVTFIAALLGYFCCFYFIPSHIFFALNSFVLGLFFLSVVGLRLMCVLDANQVKIAPPPALAKSELPSYSVLVPLFRETRVLGQLLAALTALDYPAHLLDIKLILEEDDIAMQRAIAALDLPLHIDVIIVPTGKPQTKPRALNYALQFARGELLTIYDAEDVPEPDQLQKAAAAFFAGPRNLACLQAELTFYNANENWLTRGIMAQTPQVIQRPAT